MKKKQGKEERIKKKNNQSQEKGLNNKMEGKIYRGEENCLEREMKKMLRKS